MAELAQQPVHVLAVALGEQQVVVEIERDLARELLIEQSGEVVLDRRAVVGRVGKVVHAVHDRSAERHPRLAQATVEEDRLVDRVALRGGDEEERRVRSASSSFTRSARSRMPPAMSPKLRKNSDRSVNRSMPVMRLSRPNTSPLPRPSTRRPRLPGLRKNWSERESMKRDRRFGASRKSSALRVGGVSSTSRS